MKTILTKKEFNELSQFWTQKNESAISLSQIYTKTLTKREFEHLKTIFSKKIENFDNEKIYSQLISMKFLEIRLGEFKDYINNFQREFFEFEIRSDREKFLFFIEKALLKYLIDKICGGDGKVKNKKSLTFFEENLASCLVGEIVKKMGFATNSVKFVNFSKKTQMINAIFNIKIDGFSMLCGLSFDESYFKEEFKHVYFDNGEFKDAIKKKILKTRFDCSVDLFGEFSFKEIASFYKDKIICVDEEAFFSVQDIKISKGKIKI